MENTMKSPLLKNESYIEYEFNDENLSEQLKLRTTKKLKKEKDLSVSFISNRNNVFPSSDNNSTINSNDLKLVRASTLNKACSVASSPLSIQSNSNVLNSTSSALLCRICYTSDNSREQLVQPCTCSGTMGLMHRTCLEKWLAQCNKNKCEICNYEFNVLRTCRPFEQWLFRPIATKDKKNLLNDLLCFIILTPLAIVSAWYCIIFAFRYHESENKWEASGLIILTSFLLFIYVLWIIFSSKYHYSVFREWQEKNQIVTVKIDDLKVVDDKINLFNKTPEINLNNLKRKASIETTPSIQQQQDEQQINSGEVNQSLNFSNFLNANEINSKDSRIVQV